MEGVTYVVRQRLLFSTMVLDLAAMFFGSVRALMPFYAEQVFRVGAQGLGFLYAAPGVGALLAVGHLRLGVAACAGRGWRCSSRSARGGSPSRRSAS